MRYYPLSATATTPISYIGIFLFLLIIVEINKTREVQRSTGQSRFYIPLHYAHNFCPTPDSEAKKPGNINSQKKVHWMKMSIVNANQELAFSDGRHCREIWGESSLRLRVSSLRLNCATEFGRSQSQMARVARLEGHLLN